MAVAESLTGGLLASALVDVAGSSSVFRGGVVAYNSSVKVTVLGVNADLVARQGVVNAEVAVAMALGVTELLGSDLGVATTGVAGPGPSEGVDQGRVFVAAVMTQGGTTTSAVRELVLGGTRAVVRAAATRAGLALAHSLVEQSVEPSSRLNRTSADEAPLA